MNQEIIKRWDMNNAALREYIANNNQPGSYSALVKAVISQVLNNGVNDYWEQFSEDFIKIDDGDYRGTLLFILHKNVDAPSVRHYYYCDIRYGSCSACDAFLSVREQSYDKTPTEKQVNGYMKLCLHIIQQIKTIRRIIWHN